MKKFKSLGIVITLICAVCLCLTACNNDINNNNNNNDGNDDPITHTVSFDSQGGSAVASAIVIDGNPVRLPETPVRDGYFLTGWFLDITTTNQWDFENDRVISDITLYAGWQMTNPEATPSLEYIREGDSYTVVAMKDETILVIPSTYEGLPVTKIQGEYGTGAFARKALTEVTIPDSIIEIGQNTFNNCASLIKVNISANSQLTTIGNNAFSGNSALTSIYIPKGVTSIGDNVFNNCGALEAITVASENPAYSSDGNALIEIATQTLIRGTNNTVIPNTIRVIANAAFRRSLVTLVTIPASVEIINDNSFDDCTELIGIAVSTDNQNYAGLDGILYNKAMTTMLIVPEGIRGDICLPNTITEIPSFAFDGYSNLTSVYIPKSVTNIKSFAFRNTTLTINYEGTEAEWAEVTKHSTWGGSGLTFVFGTTDEPQNATGILVVYFSISNNTESVANHVATATNGTLVEIVPETAYTSADINYNNSESRNRVELRDNARPAISSVTYDAIDMNNYAAVFIGYPIWNGYEPMIIRTFIEHYNGLSGKTVYTFSTSASSGGTTAHNSVTGLLNNAIVGGNLHSTSSQLSSAETRVSTWVNGLTLPPQSVESNRISMSFNGHQITIALVDNSATRDLISRLQNGAITLAFSDFAGSEKIAYPTPAFDLSETQGCDPGVGDLTIYTPWNNLAAFYRDTSGYSNSLVLVGHIENNGITLLAAQSGEFNVVLELI